MLTHDECGEVIGKFFERLKWYCDNVPNAQHEQRSQRFANELGLNAVELNAMTYTLIDTYIGVDPRMVDLLSPSTVEAIGAGLALGVMLGKRISELSRVSEEAL